jgi:hypothetical protein
MRVCWGKDIMKPTVMCDIRTSIWEMLISKMGQYSCMRWNSGNVGSGIGNCLANYSVLPFITL